MEWDSVPSTGQGTVHSFVVLHHPPMPGYESKTLEFSLDEGDDVELSMRLDTE